MITEYRKVIEDDNAPTRLKGKEIICTIDKVNDRMEFNVEIPDDATAQEKGYLKYFIGEFVDKLKRKVPGMIGEATYDIKPS